MSISHQNLSVTFCSHFTFPWDCFVRGFCASALYLYATLRWHLTSWGRVMTAPCCVSEEILCAKYSQQEASTERCALKLSPSTTTVTSHSVSRWRCSSRRRSTWEECTVDSNVNTDDRGEDMAIRGHLYVHTNTHTDFNN